MKRKPETTPGVAFIPKENGVIDDFTLPATLYFDSIFFFKQAVESKDSSSKNRYLRAALFSAFSFFEAQLNQVAYAHGRTHSDKLEQITRDLLEEMETTVDDKGIIIRKKRYYSLEARFSFLSLFLSGKEFDRSGLLWQKFVECKDERDLWVHPKPLFSSELTVEKIKLVIVTLREIFIQLSNMMNTEPPLWLKPLEEVITAFEKER